MKQMTDAGIRAIRNEAVSLKKPIDVADTIQRGLKLRTGASGKQTWTLVCRPAGGGNALYRRIGEYPATGIAKAREMAREMREQIRQGIDPHAVRQAAKALNEADTLDILLTRYSDSGDAPKSWKSASPRVRLVFSDLLERRCHTLKSSDFQKASDVWHSPASAGFAVRSIRPALKWCAKRDYVSKDVCDIDAKASSARERVLSRDELKAVIIALDNSKSMYAKCMKFIMFALTRRTETTRIKWSDVDLLSGILTIPASNTKNGRIHIVKLPSQAISFLSAHKPKNAKLSDLVFPNENGLPLTNFDRFTKSIHRVSKTSNWNRHDLRRTGATLLGDLGFDPHIIESALNHAVIHSGLAAVYNKSRYSNSVADALQSLANEYDNIIK